MPTATIEVAAITAPDQWTLGAGSGKVAAVNSPDNDDASYIRSPTVLNKYEQYALAANTIPSGSTINAVQVISRVKGEAGGAKFYSYVSLSGVTNQSGSHLPTSYTTYSDTLSRPGGGTWSKADIDILEIGVREGTTTQKSRCTSLRVVVDYTPPANTGDFFKLF